MDGIRRGPSLCGFEEKQLVVLGSPNSAGTSAKESRCSRSVCVPHQRGANDVSPVRWDHGADQQHCACPGPSTGYPWPPANVGLKHSPLYNYILYLSIHSLLNIIYIIPCDTERLKIQGKVTTQLPPISSKYLPFFTREAGL
jgi:hypothetical protein